MGLLHLFDMDGTLLPGTSASTEVARPHGTVDELATLEARFAAGEIDTRTFAVAVHRMWRDLTPQMVADAYAASPWLTGIPQVCADIRRRGERSVVITMSPDFFARHLRDLGFDEVVASRFPALPFAATIDPTGILTPADKVRVVEELLERYRAVNADHRLATLAAVSYRGDDLAAAYAMARMLVLDAAANGR